jgi:hypothetical protein
MTQYLLAVHHDGTPPDISPEEFKQSFADIGVFNTKLMDAGAFVFTGRLPGAESATVVRQSGGGYLVTDGPYLAAKEHLGGFWVISAADPAAALEWAREATAACRLAVEIRPFAEQPPDFAN